MTSRQSLQVGLVVEMAGPFDLDEAGVVLPETLEAAAARLRAEGRFDPFVLRTTPDAVRRSESIREDR